MSEEIPEPFAKSRSSYHGNGSALFHSSEPCRWNSGKQRLPLVMRDHVHGPILPMEAHPTGLTALLRRVMGRGL